MTIARWPSASGAKNHQALVLLEENSGKLSLYKQITCYMFLYVVNFMADALKHLSVLRKMFLKKDLDFGEVTPLLSTTIDSLEGLVQPRVKSLQNF